MKTEIFENLSAFLRRENKDINGITAQFLADNPTAQEDRGNKGCWNCSRCSDCSGCSGCSGCSDCSRCSRCSGCSGCSGCSDCTDCSDCSGCSGCSNCSDLSPQKTIAAIPKIENIHTRLLAAVLVPEALDMRDWHTCETTHCRAGWVVHMAGEAGKALEKQTSTLFAAMQIYRASSPVRVSPVRFFESNEKAMEDIRRCAQEETASIAQP